MLAMARLALLAPIFAVAACSLEKSGGLTETPDTGIPDGGGPDVNPDVTPDAPTCGTCAADEFCKAGVCTVLASCSEIHQIDGTAPTKVYFVKPSPNTTKLPVWCNMSEAGGGWTLVASTFPSGAAPFGWGSPRSDPSVGIKTEPYVLDLRGFTFTKGMITGRAGSSAPDVAPPVVTFDLPPLGPLGGSTIQTKGLTVVTPAAPCLKTDVPATLSTLGFTALTSSFYFSSSSALSDVGIFPDGFVSSDLSGCAGDQGMNGKQVLLFGHE